MNEPVSIHNSEHYLWGGSSEGWHLLRRDDLSVIQERVPPGDAEVRHYHRHSRQFFFILEGQGTMAIGDRVVVLEQHQGLEVPPLVPHQFRNESASDVVMMVISAPLGNPARIC